MDQPADMPSRLRVAVFKKVNTREALSKTEAAGPMAASCKELDRPRKALSTVVIELLAKTKKKEGKTNLAISPAAGTLAASGPPSSSGGCPLGPEPSESEMVSTIVAGSVVVILAVCFELGRLFGMSARMRRSIRL